jgi:hypothetical protein
MYVGSFQSVTLIAGINGTFNGTSLVMKGVSTRKGNALTGRLACSRTSSVQTRCTGFVTKDDGTPLQPPYNRRHAFEITWSAGQPVAMTARLM